MARAVNEALTRAEVVRQRDIVARRSGIYGAGNSPARRRIGPNRIGAKRRPMTGPRNPPFQYDEGGLRQSMSSAVALRDPLGPTPLRHPALRA